MRTGYLEEFWTCLELYRRNHGGFVPIAAIADEMGISHDGARRIALHLAGLGFCTCEGDCLRADRERLSRT
jgi:hypothetical protein